MRASLLALALAACAPEPAEEIQVGTLHLELVTPADVDPVAGAEELVVRVLDRSGAVLVRESGPVDEPLSLPELDFFGVVEVEITATSGDEVISAGRTPPVQVEPEVDRELQVLFLPVNEAVLLDHVPLVDRIEHASLVTPDGRVLLVGGREPSEDTVHGDTEWWDLESGFTELGPDLPSPVYRTSQAWVGATRLLLAGGHASPPPSADPDDLSFWISMDGEEVVATGSLNSPRAGHCLGAASGATVVAVGGRDVEEEISLEVLRSPVTSDTYQWDLVVMEDLVTSEVGDCAGTGTGWVVLTGRSDQGWGVLDLRKDSPVDVDQSFTPFPGRQDPLSEAAMVPLDNDRIWLLGGWDGASALDTGTVAYASQKALGDAPGLSTRRTAPRWRWWEEGELVVIYGGYRDVAHTQGVSSLELVHVEDGPALVLEAPVQGATMEVLPDRSIFLAGGVRDNGSPGGAWAVVPWSG